MTATTGSVHGRFQPFHLGHEEYVLAAAQRCDFLWVGITQPDSPRLQSDPTQPAHRYNPDDNPFTYWERAVMVNSALGSVLDRNRFLIVPFPIETPELVKSYIPTSAIAFTTIYEEWNRTKVDVLTAHGYDVEVLWERPTKDIAGSNVRHRMRSGDNTWRELVPPATARVLDELGLVERFRTTTA